MSRIERTCVAFASFACACAAHSATYETVHQFSGGADGAYPDSALAVESPGSLVGTATDGGSFGHGVLYRVTGTTVVALHAFTGAGGDEPHGRPVVDAAGVIYGTARLGGANGLGVVWRFDPATSTYAVLHAFAGGLEGAAPEGGLALDTDGLLYGTTTRGGGTDCAVDGLIGCGTAFKLDPRTNKLTTLHVFHDGSGIYPEWEPLISGASLVVTLSQDSTTAAFGGQGRPASMNKSDGSGYTSHGTDGLGYGYHGGLAPDAKGFVWGVVRSAFPDAGEPDNQGGFLYKMTPTGVIYHTMFIFPGDASAGSWPVGTPVVAANGVVYGAAYSGGRPPAGQGAVYAYDPKKFKFTLLHAFGRPLGDGLNPVAGPVMAPDGSLYGTTDAGGPDGFGTIYRIVP
jgi:uncharacterized repeat protein (TIGR03803 family)